MWAKSSLKCPILEFPRVSNMATRSLRRTHLVLPIEFEAFFRSNIKYSTLFYILRKYSIVTGSFVCTKCSGMLRGITPPHRIKSMSMSSFTAEEVSFLRSRGNLWCAKVWMGLYDKSRSVAPDSKVRH